MSFSGVDETLTCVQCKNPFLFSAGEQVFYQKNFENPTPPKRCKPCRDDNKAKRDGGGQSQPQGFGGGYNSRNGYNATGGYNPGAPHVAQPAAPSSYDDEKERPKKGGRRRRSEQNDGWDD